MELKDRPINLNVEIYNKLNSVLAEQVHVNIFHLIEPIPRNYIQWKIELELRNRLWSQLWDQLYNQLKKDLNK